MGGTRKQHSGNFKAQVAVVSIRGDRTMSELSSKYGVHAECDNQMEEAGFGATASDFSGRSSLGDKSQEELVSRLYQEIGQLKVELDWLKKIWTGMLKRNVRA